MESMTLFDFHLAVGQLVDEGLVIPYGKMPGQTFTSKNALGARAGEGRDTLKTRSITRTQWDRYRYNPPQFLGKTDVDENASEKPSWEDIVGGRNRYYENRLEASRNQHESVATAGYEVLLSEGYSIDVLDTAFEIIKGWIENADEQALADLDMARYSEPDFVFHWPDGPVDDSDSQE